VTADKSERTSAGIVLGAAGDRLEVLLAHQGAPFRVTKDLGHWTIPKSEVEAARPSRKHAILTTSADRHFGWIVPACGRPRLRANSGACSPTQLAMRQ
jgi:predicted NUDIX family NTP pyrophosphohydrolase